MQTAINISAYPLDTLLEERSDLALSHRVDELAGCVMGRHELDAVNEPVQLLREEHDIAAAPHGVLRALAQLGQTVLVEYVLADQDYYAESHAQTKETEDPGH